MKIVKNLAMLLGCLTSSPASASVTYVESAINTYARADVYANTIAPPSTDEKKQYSSTLPVTGFSLQSSVDKNADGGSAHAYQYASLQASSATSGLLVLSGAISTSLTSPSNGTAQALVGSLSNEYRFITTTPVLLDLNYNIFGTQNGIADPTTALDIAVAFYNNGIIYDQKFIGKGATQILLQPGDYDLFTGISRELSGKPTYINANGISERSNTYDGSLSFTIAGTTPEPSSWVMMILGLGLVGGMIRRSNRLCPALIGHASHLENTSGLPRAFADKILCSVGMTRQ